MNRVVHTLGSLALCATAFGCSERSEAPFEFTQLSYPGATATVASGINAAGDVVGWYYQGDSVRGFVYRNGEFSSVEHPDAVLTQLHGIGPGGDVVGAYRRAGETQQFQGRPVAYHGFLLRTTGEFVDVGPPDHKYSIAQRILPDGTILGCYHGDDFTESMRGMMVTGNGTSATDVPATMHNGATPDGAKVVGLAMDSGRAYVIENGVFRYYDAPDALATEAWDVNASGAIVGVFIDSTSAPHGFLLDNGTFTALDFPGAGSTVAFGINDHGDIVGVFEAEDGVRHGYVASRPRPGRGRTPSRSP